MSTVIAPPPGRTSPMDLIGKAVEDRFARDPDLALKGSPLDFEVALVPHVNPISLKPELGSDGKPKFFDVMRTDTNIVLGVVMGKYRALQNKTVFGHILPTFIEAGARVKRCATLDDGARCFMTLEWDEQTNISVVGDIVGCKGIIQTSHDGRWATTMVLYPERLACLNGMRVPIPIFKFELKVTHTVGGEQQLIDAQGAFRDASRYFQGFGQLATMLAKTKVKPDIAVDILSRIEGLKNEKGQQATKREEIMNLFQGSQPGGDHRAMKGTAWGLLGAVTDAVDYGDNNARIRMTTGQTEANQRFKRAFDNNGSSSAVKLRAFDAIIKHPALELAPRWKALERDLLETKKRDNAAKPSMN